MKERKKNLQLINALEKLVADVEYVAMMADIELEEEAEEEDGNQ